MSAIFLPCKILCMLEHGMRKKLRWIFLVMCALKPVNMIYTKEPDHFYNYVLQNRVTQTLSTHLQYTLRTTMALEFKARNKKILLKPAHMAARSKTPWWDHGSEFGKVPCWVLATVLAASTTEILRQIFGCMYSQNFMPPYKLHGASFEHTQSSIGMQHCNFRAQHIRQNLETAMSTEVYGKQASVQ
jgi:hypothetical protein